MNAIATKNVTARQPKPVAGEFVYECDDGARKSTVKVRVRQKQIPGAVVFECACACCEADGSEHDLPSLRHEIAFVPGENPDADPVVVLEALLQERARKAHAARRQLDAIAAMGLPAVPVPVHSQEAPRARAPKEEPALIEGGGNDLLADGGK